MFDFKNRFQQRCELDSAFMHIGRDQQREQVPHIETRSDCVAGGDEFDFVVRAGLLKQKLHILTAKTDREIDRAFEMLGSMRADALAVASDSFLISRRQKIVALAAKRGLPAVYAVREFAEAGGLLSYGTDFAHMYRVLGEYTGQILMGTPLADLPVQQPTTYELVINLKTAKALRLTIPQSILLRANEVIQ